jgi:hypothetical protein
MIPDVQHPVWVQIVTGKKQLISSKTTFNMLIHNNKMSYERDPSPRNIQQLIAKTHKFMAQFESVFASEVTQILG